jgi:hypothetical protein
MTTVARLVTWVDDCYRYRGGVLTGYHAHWCDDWDGLPVDETTGEWPCTCPLEVTTPGLLGPYGLRYGLTRAQLAAVDLMTQVRGGRTTLADQARRAALAALDAAVKLVMQRAGRLTPPRRVTCCGLTTDAARYAGRAVGYATLMLPVAVGLTLTDLCVVTDGAFIITAIVVNGVTSDVLHHGSVCAEAFAPLVIDRGPHLDLPAIGGTLAIHFENRAPDGALATAIYLAVKLSRPATLITEF